MSAVREWVSRRARPNSQVAYFFEAGHKHQGRANWIMNEVFRVPAVRQNFRYVGHAFVDKAVARPCQAADLLAWQWFTERKRLVRGEPTRKDLASLLELPHMADHTTGQLALQIIEANAAGRSINDIDELAEPLVLAVPRK